ncbi:MAG: hypothetical protein A2W03_14805 [Candidatus Aminicenantes bacterium RBG_16_63_16]|nr:MAG: hypothetical protein A2W03_14805 [Candidatus Aminicenantes bacterium RBG_16_63_16]
METGERAPGEFLFQCYKDAPGYGVAVRPQEDLVFSLPERPDRKVDEEPAVVRRIVGVLPGERGGLDRRGPDKPRPVERDVERRGVALDLDALEHEPSRVGRGIIEPEDFLDDDALPQVFYPRLLAVELHPLGDPGRRGVVLDQLRVIERDRAIGPLEAEVDQARVALEAGGVQPDLTLLSTGRQSGKRDEAQRAEKRGGRGFGLNDHRHPPSRLLTRLKLRPGRMASP